MGKLRMGKPSAVAFGLPMDHLRTIGLEILSERPSADVLAELDAVLAAVRK
jgi:hypothetical protein